MQAEIKKKKQPTFYRFLVQVVMINKKKNFSSTHAIGYGSNSASSGSSLYDWITGGKAQHKSHLAPEVPNLCKVLIVLRVVPAHVACHCHLRLQRLWFIHWTTETVREVVGGTLYQNKDMQFYTTTIILSSKLWGKLFLFTKAASKLWKKAAMN